nr:hypothetical protein [Aneurinibacillus sp. XH2]
MTDRYWSGKVEAHRSGKVHRALIRGGDVVANTGPMQERYKEMNVIALERQDRIRYRRDLLLQENRASYGRSCLRCRKLNSIWVWFPEATRRTAMVDMTDPMLKEEPFDMDEMSA